MEKTVPLVVYEDGIRHVIGDALVNLETGEVTTTYLVGKQLTLSDIASVTIRGSMSFSVPESLEGPRQTIEQAIPEEEDAKPLQHPYAYEAKCQEPASREEETSSGGSQDPGRSLVQDYSPERWLDTEPMGRRDNDS